MTPPNNEPLTMDGAATLLSDGTAPSVAERRDFMASPDMGNLAHKLDLVTQERDMLRKALDAAHEREAALLRVLEHLPLALERHGPTRPPVVPSGRPLASARRQQILDVLGRYPSGLHRRQIQEQLGLENDLSSTLGHMKRDGLLVHKGSGIYALAGAKAAPRA